MIFTAGSDIYGNPETVTSGYLSSILYLLDRYMGRPYAIREIRRDDVEDPNGRVDIEVEYLDENSRMIRQKLLILNGEVIDGLTFHKRYKEWYGDEK